MDEPRSTVFLFPIRIPVRVIKGVSRGVLYVSLPPEAYFDTDLAAVWTAAHPSGCPSGLLCLPEEVLCVLLPPETCFDDRPIVVWAAARSEEVL